MLHPHDSLYSDPFALMLGGDIGKSWAEELALKNPMMFSKEKFAAGIAVRTTMIDRTLQAILTANPAIHQICTLGAGLDTRPWRLSLSTVDFFEVDFHEIFAFKLPLLAREGAMTTCRYHAVEADLSLGNWMDRLQAAGLDPSRPTVWLLEGLTGYLTLEENLDMFTRIRAASAPGSHIIATFITPQSGKKTGLSLHRCMPEDPLGLLRGCGGWEGKAIDLADSAQELDREPEDKSGIVRGYLLVIVGV